MTAPQVTANALYPVLAPGTMIGGRYRIERCLGSGGMASVYRAMHTGLDQPVAIKLVSPSIRELPGMLTRFLREARAATRLKGEHVVRVFDVGTCDDGAPYLAMELLEGKDLGELLAVGSRPSVHEAIDYALQACEALAEVHGLGIVHRDLKPANLFVASGPDGRPCLKLIDFGISRIDSPLSGKDAIALTNPEVVMGSPRYMPPEQMESAAAADSRSDIWGLGAILYEMVVGDAPFDGESLFDIYAAAVRSAPRVPSSVNHAIPRGLDEVILRCLRVEPSERYSDVAELALALAPFGDDDAPGRVEAIARMLDAARARGGGDLESVAPPGTAKDPSSRIRRRISTANERKQTTRKRVLLAAGTIALFGLGLIARPIAQRLDLSPTVSVTGASAATSPIPEPPTITSAVVEPSTEVQGTPDPTPTPAVTPVAIANVAPVAVPAATTAPHRHAPTAAAIAALPAPTPAAPPVSVATSPASSLAALPTNPGDDVEPQPKPAATTRTDDRTLFEDRK